MKLNLRLAQAEDAPGITSLVKSAYSLYLDRMDREPAPILADYPALIMRQVVTVAVSDGELAGMLVCYPCEQALHVENVSVDPAFQGQGIGGKLMSHAEDIARTRKLSRVELYTNEVMTENIGFYEARGYSIQDQSVQDGYSRIFFELKLM